MADESGFWLPSDFLTDDDFLFMPNDPASLTNNAPKCTKPPLNLPSTLNNGHAGPRLFRSSSALTSPGESVVSSTETDSNDDRDDFIAELTRQLSHSTIRERVRHTHEKQAWAPMATSPQSTLTGFRRNDEAWELIYAAAQRVARMRLNHQAAARGLLSSSSSSMELRTPPVCYNAPHSNNNNNNNQFQGCAVHGLPQSAWPPLRPQPPASNHACGGAGMRAVFLGPANGMKRQSTGTGVFLPRRAVNNMTEPRKKQQGCSTVLLPARVVQALNLNIDEMNGHAQPCLAPNHDVVMGRRNAAAAAALGQQRRGLRGEGPIAMNQHEVPLLPQEWTY